MILRLKYQFWHKNTNNYLDFQEFIEKVTKTAVFRTDIESEKSISVKDESSVGFLMPSLIEV
jgi:hypothetical protein